MKNANIQQTSLTTYPFGKSKLLHQDLNDQNNLDFPEFTAPTPMTEQEIAPPLHVWERIANVLDQQDMQKKMLRKHQTVALTQPNSTRKLA